MSGEGPEKVTPEMVNYYKTKCKLGIQTYIVNTDFTFNPEVCNKVKEIYEFLLKKERFNTKRNEITNERNHKLLDDAYRFAIKQIHHQDGGKRRTRHRRSRTHRKRRHTSLKRK